MKEFPLSPDLEKKETRHRASPSYTVKCPPKRVIVTHPRTIRYLLPSQKLFLKRPRPRPAKPFIALRAHDDHVTRSPRQSKELLLAEATMIAAFHQDPLHTITHRRPSRSSLGFRQERRRRRSIQKRGRAVWSRVSIGWWYIFGVAVEGGFDVARVVVGGRIEIEGDGGAEDRICGLRVCGQYR